MAACSLNSGVYLFGLRPVTSELCFARGLPGEAQRRYEQAAMLAADAASALHNAASAAEIRNFGNEAIMLHRAGGIRRRLREALQGTPDRLVR